jgi:hypothetical protein
MAQTCCDDCGHKDPLRAQGTSCLIGYSTVTSFDREKGLHIYYHDIGTCDNYWYVGNRPTRFEKILSDEHL